jgi:hypothetical protein
MARKNGYLDRYAEVGGLKDSLERIYTGQVNVAREALELGLESDDLKEIFRAYVADHPLDPDAWNVTDEAG